MHPPGISQIDSVASTGYLTVRSIFTIPTPQIPPCWRRRWIPYKTWSSRRISTPWYSKFLSHRNDYWLTGVYEIFCWHDIQDFLFSSLSLRIAFQRHFVHLSISFFSFLSLAYFLDIYSFSPSYILDIKRLDSSSHADSLPCRLLCALLALKLSYHHQFSFHIIMSIPDHVWYTIVYTLSFHSNLFLDSVAMFMFSPFSFLVFLVFLFH